MGLNSMNFVRIMLGILVTRFVLFRWTNQSMYFLDLLEIILEILGTPLEVEWMGKKTGFCVRASGSASEA